MIKVDRLKTVYYYNEYGNAIIWGDKGHQCFYYYLIKNNVDRFHINNKEYVYYDQNRKIIKEGKDD